MDGDVLASYLQNRGFIIKSISTVDAQGNMVFKDSAHGHTANIVKVPLSKGLTGFALPKCQRCSKSFANETALSNHFKSEHGGSPDVPIKVETKEEDLNYDESRISAGGSQYEIVDSSFISFNNAEPSENTEETSYIIIRTTPESDYNYNNGARRTRRVETKPRKPYEPKVAKINRIQEVKGPFQCVQCSQLFLDCCDYSQHYYDEHSKRRKPIHRCQICEKKFDTVKTVSEPVPSIELKTDYPKTEKQYNCEICLKSFAQPTGLNQHMKTHSGIKPFLCNICMKAFAQKAGLDQHMRIHNNQRPFTCVVCKKTFTQSAHLSQHIRIHTKIEPFKCDVCQRRFKQSSHLNFHLKSHEKLQADGSVMDIYVSDNMDINQAVQAIAERGQFTAEGEVVIEDQQEE